MRCALRNVQDGAARRGHNDSIMRIPLFPLAMVLFPGAALHFATLHMAGIQSPAIHLDLNAPVAFQLADALPSDLGFKQQLLASRSDADRTTRLRDFYNEMLPRLRAKEDVSRAMQPGFPIH